MAVRVRERGGRVQAQPLIRVIVVHDMVVVRAGLACLLASLDDMLVVAELDRLAPPFDGSLCRELRADIVLIDPYRPGAGGSDLMERLRRSCPDVRVVTITGSRDDVALRAAMHAGAAACVRITVDQQELAGAIRGAMQGRFVLPSDMLRTLLHPQEDLPVATVLTARESDVLTLLADGRTNKGIALALGLTEGTVRGYVSGILTKLGVANRTEATGVAIRQGMLAQG
jgi:DNA-binding NarL/FixJ family response regulator